MALVLKSKERSAASLPSPALQASEKGAVSALDYAISRGANWVIDMFGMDSRGTPLARRLFSRSNPERKRPGPVVISINERFMRLGDIEIFSNGVLITGKDELNLLCHSLAEQSSWPLQLSLGAARCHESEAVDFLKALRPGFLHELKLMLRATDIFSRRALRRALSALSEVDALEPIRKRFLSDFESLDLSLTSSARFGLNVGKSEMHILFPGGRPLRFGVTPSQIGTLALLRYLRDVRRLPIEIDYSFAHTSDLARGIAENSGSFPECCVMTTASFALLHETHQSEFVPVMVMPAATHTVVGRSGVELRSDAGEYFLLSDFPTTPLFWFDALRKARVVGAARGHHAEPDEAFDALRSGDGDARAILWFPYNLMALRLANVTALLHAPSEGSGLGYVQNILFVHRSFESHKLKKRLLDMLLRDAWLNLLESEQLRGDMVDSQIVESEYRRSLWRYSGLFRQEQAAA